MYTTQYGVMFRIFENPGDKLQPGEKVYAYGCHHSSGYNGIREVVILGHDTDFLNLLRAWNSDTDRWIYFPV